MHKSLSFRHNFLIEQNGDLSHFQINQSIARRRQSISGGPSLLFNIFLIGECIIEKIDRILSDLKLLLLLLLLLLL